MSGSSVVVTCGPRVKFPSLLYLVGMALVVALSSSDTIVPVAASPTRRTPFSSAFSRLPGRSYDSSGDDDDDNGGNGEHNRNSNGFSVQGTGREFDLFDTRADNSNLDPTNDNTDANMDDVHDTEWNDESDTGFPRRSTASAAYQRNNHHNGGYPRAVPAASYTSRRAPPYRRSSTFGSISRDGSTSSNSGVGSNGGSSLPFLQTVQEWWSTTLPHFPKLKCRLEPTTTLKIQKTFRPLGTIIRLGAEFNTQLGVWRFRSSWEDAIIGGKLTLAGKELQLSKSWQLSMGEFDTHREREREREREVTTLTSCTVSFFHHVCVCVSVRVFVSFFLTLNVVLFITLFSFFTHTQVRWKIW